MRVQVDVVWARVDLSTLAEREWLKRFLSFMVKRFVSQHAPPKFEKLQLYDDERHRFPAGFAQFVVKAALAQGFEAAAEDVRPPGPIADLSKMPEWLYDYQQAAVRSAVKRTRGVVQLPTGAGKTEIAIGLTQVIEDHWLFLVNSGDLLLQTAERFEARTGEKAGVIGAGRWEEERFTVATFQTLYAALFQDIGERNLQAEALVRRARGILVDECFPAGTMIGNVPIERVAAGDLVPSFDVQTGRTVRRRVLTTFKRLARNLVRVYLETGEAIVTTPGHPFLTSEGWLPASEICGLYVRRVEFAHEDGDHNVRVVQERDQIVRSSGVGARPPAENVLFSSLQNLGAVKAWAQDCVGAQGDALPPNAGAQPDARERDAREDGADTQADRASPQGAGRQRTRSDAPAEKAGACSRMEDGDSYSNEAAAREGLPDGVQGRHSEHPLQDRGGSRRGIPLLAQAAGVGQEEGCLAHFVRVDRVEVLERGSNGEYGSVCPDGKVYNLHVEGTETYLVDGVVVHNCHTLPADSLKQVAYATDRAHLRIGMSATPFDRSDSRGVLVMGCLGPLLFRIPAKLLIERGFLSRPEITMLTVKHPPSDRKTWDGVQTQCIVKGGNFGKRNKLVVDVASKAKKPGLVFVTRAKHGQTLTRQLQEAGLNAEYVSGEKTSVQRKRAIVRLEDGDLDFIVCTVVFQQGVDIPSLRTLINASGGKALIATLQKLGRGMRVTEEKKTVDVFDFMDLGCGCKVHTDFLHKSCEWLEKHARARKNAYKREGYPVRIENEQPALF